MTTTLTYEYVTVRFEACDSFLAEDTDSPCCHGCGWLDDEHGSDTDVDLDGERGEAGGR